MRLFTPRILSIMSKPNTSSSAIAFLVTFASEALSRSSVIWITVLSFSETSPRLSP